MGDAAIGVPIVCSSSDQFHPIISTSWSLRNSTVTLWILAIVGVKGVVILGLEVVSELFFEGDTICIERWVIKEFETPPHRSMISGNRIASTS